ncbi:MAG: chloride channel protein [Anaerolineales bacterium]|nr:chloride channel protein [Anaerolineales bacterium]
MSTASLASPSLYKRSMIRFGKWLNRRQPSEEVIVFGTALLVGLGAGIGAVIFRYLIQAVEWIGYTWFPSVTSNWGNAYVVIVPAIGGLIVGLLVYFFAPEAKGHGVPEVMEAVAIHGGRIRPRVAVIKSLASSICIGSGGSVGREGPIVQIGSALGSALGQKLHLSNDRVRNLVACGAAGGIAATFNAPIAGVIFALEIILGDFKMHYFISVVISSVTASVIGRVVFGDIPAFPLPTEYGVNSLWEFGFYSILGVLAALVGVIFVRSLYWTEDLFEKWKSVPEWVQPAVGGALLGSLALAYPLFTPTTWEGIPHIYNVGYEVIGGALSNQLLLGVVLSLLILKIVATSLTLGSGGSGGVFAPGLFMGAMLGTAFELSIRMLFPSIVAPPGAYALVGMAAVFAATAHAPITAIIILFELTGDYRIILPLMLTVVVATLLAQKMLAGESIYTLKLSRRGVHLQSGQDIDVMDGVTVDEVMTREVDTIPTDTTLSELSRILSQSRHHGIAILDDQGKLWGLVTVTDLDRAIDQNLPGYTPVTAIGTDSSRLMVAYPDESMGEALARMGIRGVGRLPVISRERPDYLLGLIRRADIIRAYNIALARRAEIQRDTRHAHNGAAEGTEFIEFTLSAGDKIIGSAVKDIAVSMPNECILISIHRDGKVLIPHGNSVIQEGDQITAFIRSEDVEALHQCLHGDNTESM